MQSHFNLELRRVIRAGAGQFNIIWWRTFARLRPFLQSGLWVARIGLDGGDPRIPKPQDQRLRFSKATIAIHRSNQRFHGIAQQCFLAPPAADHLRATQFQQVANANRARHICTGFLAHKSIKTRRQLPLGRLRIQIQQSLRHHEPKNPVTQKLKPFVVRAGCRGDTGMSQSCDQEPRVFKLIADIG